MAIAGTRPQTFTKEMVQQLLSELNSMPAREKLELLADLEKLEHQRELQACRDDFLKFCHRVYPNFKEGPHHRHLKTYLNKVLEGTLTRMTVSMPPRFGKALALDTEIPTPDRGFVRMGDLRVGDKVFAGDGSITTVVGVSPVWSQRPVYRVTTNDGYSVIADAAHEWNVVKDRKRPRWDTVDTAYVHRKTAADDARALRIPLQGSAQYSAASLPVHPYVLGTWLGDGRTDHAAMCTADDFSFNKVNELEGAAFTEYAPSGVTRRWRPGPLGKRGDTASLQARLRSLGVIGNKHIPDAYLHASPEQRLALLQGLVDTDGGVGKNGCVTFTNTNERLARQVQELVQSLGTKASLTVGPAMLRGVQHGWCWKVHFFHPQAASLPRKAERCRAATRTTERYIRAEPAGFADTVCIEVAHPSHLFLCTRGYIPTHNSETIAYLYVAWYLGHHPEHHIMMVTHTATLSSSFGRKIRNLIESDKYREIFPETQVSRDKSAADDWSTTKGGKYLAIGIGANVAGHGAHLLICDDLVSEQAVLANPDDVFDTAWEYIQVGPLQRLMPGGRVVMIATRWGVKDPIGRALQWAKNNPLSPRWEEIRFPAILPSGKSLWPEQWPVEQLISKRESMFAQFWAAQYMQEPTNDEGALIKREWWQPWEKEDAPACEYIIMALDAAAEMTNRSDCTAITTWGVFSDDKHTQGASHIILLDCINERMEFPQLKDKAIEQWRTWEPDCFIVEKKSNGAALFQELRRMGIPVQEFMPTRASGDKYARLNAVADVFRSGLVWYPAGRKWAEEVVEQVAAFPYGDGDDIVDTTSMALARFRNGGFIRLPSDEEDEQRSWRRKREYY